MPRQENAVWPIITQTAFPTRLLFFTMSNQASRWVFTINNPTDVDRGHVAELGNSERVKYLVVGREQGEQGTPHLQGFVVFNGSFRLSRVSRLLPRAHLEAAKGTSRQASDYCKKEGDFDEYGECPGQSGANGVLQPLYDWGAAFIAEKGRAPTSPEIARAHPTAYLRYPRAVALFQHQAPAPEIRTGTPGGWQAELEAELEGAADDRSILFYVDPEGGQGKTWFQQYFLTKHPEDVQILTIGKRDDLAHAIDETKSIFMFNVPRGGMEFLQYTILEQLKDQMVFSPKYNSRTKILRLVPHVLVFCNEEPDQSKMSMDRFDIRELS